jgi:hypothetical protein
MYDLDQPGETHLRWSDDSEISYVVDMAVSPAGFIALRCDTKIMLFDLSAGTLARKASVNSAVSATRGGSWDYTLLASDEGYHFDLLEFSSSGYTLVAWAWGSNSKNSIFRWNIDPNDQNLTPKRLNYYLEWVRCHREVEAKHFVDRKQTPQQSQPTPISSLLLASEFDDDFIDCVIRERGNTGAFFTVRLKGPSGLALKRGYILRRDANEVEHAALHQDTHLITITHKGGIRKKKVRVAAYPLDIDEGRSGKVDVEFEQDFTNLVPDCKSCRMEMVESGDNLNLVILGFDGKIGMLCLRQV